MVALVAVAAGSDTITKKALTEIVLSSLVAVVLLLLLPLFFLEAVLTKAFNSGKKKN